jgi:uncharacterized protein
MAEQFLHGVQVIESQDGARPIQTVTSSVIGMVGTAPNADPVKFPLNTPVLIAGSRIEAAALGATGTLPSAIDGIFDQTGAMIVVVRVDQNIDHDTTISHVIGGVDVQTGQQTGVQALLGAESTLGVVPRILIAPGFTGYVTRGVGGAIEGAPVASEMVGIAERLRAVVIADGPNTNDVDAIAYRNLFGSERVYVIDPWVKVWDTEANAEAIQAPSARVAGLIAKSDNERGFWWSPSNLNINGIIGVTRAIDFTLGDANARANYLNENEVATIIRKDGYRLWGNRTCAADPKWMFLSVRRTADMINDSLLRNHMWAVDRNISKTYVKDVTDGVNAYLRHLTAIGAILGGKCWTDPELNTPTQVAQGKVFFDFDFTPPYPAENITFRSQMVNDYLEEVFK